MGSIAELAAKPCKRVSVKSSAFSFPPILSLDSTNQQIASSEAAVGNMREKQKTFPVVGIHQYQGLFKVVPTSTSGFGEVFNVRLEALDVLDWIWLDVSRSNGTPTISSSNAPTQPDSYILAVLHQDASEIKTIDTYTLAMKTRELNRWTFSKKVDESALFMIPISVGGFILVSENFAEYINPSVSTVSCSTTFRPALFTTYCMIDESRYLLSDSNGIMYILALTLTPPSPSIHCTPLGVVIDIHPTPTDHRRVSPQTSRT